MSQNQLFLLQGAYAWGAVLCLLITAHFMGSWVLKPARYHIRSGGIFHLSATILGIGSIGLLTLLAGATIGFSPLIIKLIFIPSALIIVGFRIARREMPLLSFPANLNWATGLLLVVTGFHFIAYFLTGLSYPYGSDSFSYVLVAQQHLRQGHFAPMLLEPLGEIVPIFTAPCLFEMVYVNLLGLSNLISLTIFAKIQMIITFLLAFSITKQMGGQYAGWLALAILWTEPIIAYFAGESSDNYFISISFEILCLYFLWLYYRLPKQSLLIYAGISAGMMIAVKLTACYYLFALILLMPILVHASNRLEQPASNFCGRLFFSIKGTSIFLIPALLIGGVFPLLLYTISGKLIIGLDWTVAGLGGKPLESWIYPFYTMFYNNLLRYNSIFESSPNFPYWLAGIESLLSYYLINPFKIHGNPVWIFFHTPISLLIGSVFPLLFLFYRRLDGYFKWLAAVLLIAQGVKLINYPLIIPPKSEMFQIVPAAMLFASILGISNFQVLTAGNFWSVLKRLLGRMLGYLQLPKTAVSICILILLPFFLVNAWNVGTHYRQVIKSYAGVDVKSMATFFEQGWFIDNLTEEDVLLGRQPNQICYIQKPAVSPFFWEVMYFVPWKIVEKRITDLRVTVIYDSSKPPDKIKAGYEKILPVLMARDPQLFNRLQRAIALYVDNYEKKASFLTAHYTMVQNDGSGSTYVKNVAIP